jgi:exodeoxyribonuclease VII small subunit
MAKSIVPTFEEAMIKLEDIVNKLEVGSLGLSESIAEFENAIKLIKLCEEKLNDAKQKVRILTENADGVITDSDFVGTDINED